jgi:hypothetical protein
MQIVLKMGFIGCKSNFKMLLKSKIFLQLSGSYQLEYKKGGNGFLFPVDGFEQMLYI